MPAGAEALTDSRDRRQNLPGEGHGISRRLELPEAIVAGLAGGLPVRFPEVRDEAAMPAAHAGRVTLDIAQQHQAAFGRVWLRRKHRPPPQEVPARVDQHALGLEAVAARPAGLLLVVLE